LRIADCGLRVTLKPQSANPKPQTDGKANDPDALPGHPRGPGAPGGGPAAGDHTPHPPPPPGAAPPGGSDPPPPRPRPPPALARTSRSPGPGATAGSDGPSHAGTTPAPNERSDRRNARNGRGSIDRLRPRVSTSTPAARNSSPQGAGPPRTQTPTGRPAPAI